MTESVELQRATVVSRSHIDEGGQFRHEQYASVAFRQGRKQACIEPTMGIAIAVDKVQQLIQTDTGSGTIGGDRKSTLAGISKWRIDDLFETREIDLTTAAGGHVEPRPEVLSPSQPTQA